MNEAQTMEQLEGTFGFVTYITILFIVGIVCCLIMILRYAFRRSNSSGGKVRGWNVSWTDFGFFVWIVFCWILFSTLLIEYFFGNGESSESHSEIWEIVAANITMQAGVIAIFIVLRYYRKRSFAENFNTRRMHIFKALPIGIFIFIAAFPAIFLVGFFWMDLLHYLKISGYNVSADQQGIVELLIQEQSPFSFLALGFMVTVMAPVAEELLFRGAIYRFFKSRVPTVNAMFISAVLFALLHFNLASFPSLVVVGIFLCIAYEVSGNLKVPIVFHAVFNLNSMLLISLQPQLSELAQNYISLLHW